MDLRSYAGRERPVSVWALWSGTTWSTSTSNRRGWGDASVPASSRFVRQN